MAMTTFIKISLTYYENNPRFSYGRIDIDTHGLSLGHGMEISEAEEELRKLQRKLGKEPIRTVSPHNPNITFVELYGFID